MLPWIDWKGATWTLIRSLVTLRFPNADLEAEFRLSLVKKRLTLLHLTLPCLIVVFGSLGVYETYFITDPDIQNKFRLIRYAGQVPSLFLFFWLSFTSLYKRHVQAFNVLLSSFLGLTNITLAIFGQTPDHAPVMLFFYVIYMFLHLHYLFAAAVAWFLQIVFMVAVHWALPDYPRYWLASGYITVCNLSLCAAAYVIDYWARVDFRQQILLNMEVIRTTDLLETLLPPRITQKLRSLARQPGLTLQPEQSLVETFESVAVLFSDIVGFTAFCAQLRAREVVTFLNTLYTSFDHLTSTHGVLKIETIGDAYFVAAGIEPLKPDTTPTIALANLALDMQFIMKAFQGHAGQALALRIGLHTGPVIGGVVGKRVPRYHLFGETVDRALQLEQTGLPGQNQLSAAAAHQLQACESFLCTPREFVTTEGVVEETQTYFLTSSEAI